MYITYEMSRLMLPFYINIFEIRFNLAEIFQAKPHANQDDFCIKYTDAFKVVILY